MKSLEKESGNGRMSFNGYSRHNCNVETFYSRRKVEGLSKTKTKTTHDIRAKSTTQAICLLVRASERKSEKRGKSDEKTTK